MHESTAKRTILFFYTNVYSGLNVKKQKAVFATLSCLLTHVNFLHYAKFMHFDALQYFSLLNSN